MHGQEIAFHTFTAASAKTNGTGGSIVASSLLRLQQPAGKRSSRTQRFTICAEG